MDDVPSPVSAAPIAGLTAADAALLEAEAKRKRAEAEESTDPLPTRRLRAEAYGLEAVAGRLLDPGACGFPSCGKDAAASSRQCLTSACRSASRMWPPPSKAQMIQRGLVGPSEIFEMRQQPFRVLDRFEDAVHMDRNVVPGRHHLAVLALGGVPGRRNVGLRSLKPAAPPSCAAGSGARCWRISSPLATGWPCA